MPSTMAAAIRQGLRKHNQTAQQFGKLARDVRWGDINVPRSVHNQKLADSMEAIADLYAGYSRAYDEMLRDEYAEI